MMYSTTQANIKIDNAPLEGVLNVLTTLYNGWTEAIKALRAEQKGRKIMKTQTLAELLELTVRLSGKLEVVSVRIIEKIENEDFKSLQSLTENRDRLIKANQRAFRDAKLF